MYFGEGMTRPELIRDDTPEFSYPKDALEAKVEGTVLVKCSVTVTGTLRDCKVLKRLPHIEDAQILSWLAQWKMKPAMLGDKPVAVKSYTIPITLMLPK
jgi:protein TonB